jgi:two-component system, chemotaxis family, protein-glutamate methylesterase/glutaminase
VSAPNLTRVLIAEDDALLRELLEALLRPDFPELTLVSNGLQAINHLQEHQVDVLVTDWMMPEMDGIELIRRVRTESAEPPFIIMNTVLGTSEARAHALRSGADDFLAKPTRPGELRACIERATQRRDSSRRLPKARPVFFTPALPRPVDGQQSHVVVAIAASTGGPAALTELFSERDLPSSCVYLVALHGPEWLHQSVAESLRRVSPLSFVLAEDGVVARPGVVYFACKDRHLAIDVGLRLKCEASPPEHFLRPAADPTFRSVARSCGRYAVAVVLTGMGHDGAAGAAEVAAAGGTVLAQDPRTAVIGSMPGAVIDAGLAREVFPLMSIGKGVARHAESLNKALAQRAAQGVRGLASV